MSFKTDIQATRSDAAAGASAIIAQPIRLRGIIIASNDIKTHESKCKQIKAIIKEFNLFPIDN